MSSESRLSLIRSRFAARTVVLPVSADFRPVPSARHSATRGGTVFRPAPLREEVVSVSAETLAEISAMFTRPALSPDAERWIGNGWSGAGPSGVLP